MKTGSQASSWEPVNDLEACSCIRETSCAIVELVETWRDTEVVITGRS